MGTWECRKSEKMKYDEYRRWVDSERRSISPIMSLLPVQTLVLLWNRFRYATFSFHKGRTLMDGCHINELIRLHTLRRCGEFKCWLQASGMLKLQQLRHLKIKILGEAPELLNEELTKYYRFLSKASMDRWWSNGYDMENENDCLQSFIFEDFNRLSRRVMACGSGDTKWDYRPPLDGLMGARTSTPVFDNDYELTKVENDEIFAKTSHIYDTKIRGFINPHRGSDKDTDVNSWTPVSGLKRSDITSEIEKSFTPTFSGDSTLRAVSDQVGHVIVGLASPIRPIIPLHGQGPILQSSEKIVNFSRTPLRANSESVKRQLFVPESPNKKRKTTAATIFVPDDVLLNTIAERPGPSGLQKTPVKPTTCVNYGVVAKVDLVGNSYKKDRKTPRKTPTKKTPTKKSLLKSLLYDESGSKKQASPLKGKNGGIFGINSSGDHNSTFAGAQENSTKSRDKMRNAPKSDFSETKFTGGTLTEKTGRVVGFSGIKNDKGATTHSLGSFHEITPSKNVSDADSDCGDLVIVDSSPEGTIVIDRTANPDAFSDEESFEKHLLESTSEGSLQIEKPPMRCIESQINKNLGGGDELEYIKNNAGDKEYVKEMIETIQSTGSVFMAYTDCRNSLGLEISTTASLIESISLMAITVPKTKRKNFYGDFFKILSKFRGQKNVVPIPLKSPLANALNATFVTYVADIGKIASEFLDTPIPEPTGGQNHGLGLQLKFVSEVMKAEADFMMKQWTNFACRIGRHVIDLQEVVRQNGCLDAEKITDKELLLGPKSTFSKGETNVQNRTSN